MAHYRFDELVTRMAGRDTLNGWDVLVSYKSSVIADELNKQVSASALLDPLIWEEPLTDVFANSSKIQIRLQLQPPTFSFKGEEGVVDLTFPMKECSWQGGDRTSDKTVILPPGLSVVLSAPLRAISGQFAIGVRGNKFLNLDSGSTSFVNANDVNILEHHEVNQPWAFSFDFEHVLASIVPPEHTLQPLHRIICRKIAEVFEARRVHFYMGSLRQIMTDEPSIMNGIVLRPSRFRFTISGSALCIWTQVFGMDDHSLEPSRRRKLEFRPDGIATNPIPEGFDASIIFSEALMQKFLQQGLCFPNLCATLQNVPASNGISTKMFLNNHQIVFPRYHRESSGISSHAETVNACSIDLNASPPVLRIEMDNKVSVKYKEEFSIGWSWSQTVPGYLNPIYTSDKGSIPAALELKGTGQWSTSADATRANQIVLRLSVDPDWCKIKGKTFDKSRDPKFFIRNVKAPAVPFTSAEMTLDYKNITNILFPSKCCFEGPDLGANNFAVPKDAILLGRIKHGTSAAQHSLRRLGARAEDKSVKDFVKDLLSEPAVPMRGDLINVIASTSDDIELKVQAVLHQYGYPQFTAEDILSSIRLSPEALFGPIENHASSTELHLRPDQRNVRWTRHKEESPPCPDLSFRPSANQEEQRISNLVSVNSIDPIDIRLYGGRYIVSAPPSDAGAVLVIHPVTAEVFHEGEISVPNVTLDMATSDTLMSWSRNGRQFKTTFSVYINPATNIGGISIQGLVTDAQDMSTTFLAQLERITSSNTRTRKGKRHISFMENGDAPSDSFSLEDTSNDWIESDGLILAIMLGATVLTLLALGAIISKGRGSRNAAQVAAANAELMQTGLEEYRRHLTTRARIDAQTELRNRDWAVGQIVERVEERMRVIVDISTSIQQYRDWILTHDIAAAEPNSPGVEILREVRGQMTEVLSEELRPMLEGMLDARRVQYGVPHMLMEPEWVQLRNEVTTRMMADATNALESQDIAQHDHASFLEATTMSMVRDARARLYEEDIRTSTEWIERCNTRIDNINNRENVIRARLEREPAEDVRQRLLADIERLTNQRESERASREAFEADRRNTRVLREANELERREAQERTREARQRARESLRGR